MGPGDRRRPPHQGLPGGDPPEDPGHVRVRQGPRRDRAVHPGRLRRTGDGRERHFRRRGRYRRRRRLRLLHLRPRPAGPRALLPEHGQGLRRVDQQDHQAARGNARVRGDGLAPEAREGHRRRPDPDGTPVHPRPHQRFEPDPDRQREDRLLLRRDPREDDHPRHPEGGRAVLAIRRADRRVRRQPGGARGVAGAEHPGLPQAPDRDAEDLPGGDPPDLRRPGQCLRSRTGTRRDGLADDRAPGGHHVRRRHNQAGRLR